MRSLILPPKAKRAGPCILTCTAVRRHAEAIAIDREKKCVVLKGPRPNIPYDVLSINIGSSPQMLSKATRQGAKIPITPVKVSTSEQ